MKRMLLLLLVVVVDVSCFRSSSWWSWRSSRQPNVRRCPHWASRTGTCCRWWRSWRSGESRRKTNSKTWSDTKYVQNSLRHQKQFLFYMWNILKIFFNMFEPALLLKSVVFDFLIRVEMHFLEKKWKKEVNKEWSTLRHAIWTFGLPPIV